MLTRLLVIQKINENGVVNIFQTSSGSFQWAFQSNVSATRVSPAYFPFDIMGNVKTIEREPGPETQTSVRKNEILFKDDYSIPSGSVIGILFPKNYIIDVLKFKEQPFIPVGIVGQVVSHPPGQIQIFYNQTEKKSAIV